MGGGTRSWISSSPGALIPRARNGVSPSVRRAERGFLSLETPPPLGGPAPRRGRRPICRRKRRPPARPLRPVSDKWRLSDAAPPSRPPPSILPREYPPRRVSWWRCRVQKQRPPPSATSYGPPLRRESCSRRARASHGPHFPPRGAPPKAHPATFRHGMNCVLYARRKGLQRLFFPSQPLPLSSPS